MENSMRRSLTALPIFNEADHVNQVLDEVARYCDQILVVDDGSTDGTASLLARRSDVRVITHPSNRGYGAALQSAFQYAIDHEFHVLVTIDCDGQHEPQRIRQFVKATATADIVSGSRYLHSFSEDTVAPAERRWVNQCITAKLNARLGLRLTDAFCGFKAYRVAALKQLHIHEDGYAMPLELWVQAVANHLHVIEIPVPLIYLEEERSFGGSLDNARIRLQYYHEVLERSVAGGWNSRRRGSRSVARVQDE